MLPSLFISHGAPTLPLSPSPAREFLAGLGQSLPRPRAILAVSAHWETAAPEVNEVGVNDTIHDFHGFPRALYDIRYPAPGGAELAERVRALLGAAGTSVGVDHARGLDHGAWVPLMLMYPEADIPVVQLSVQTDLGPAHHLALGRALAPLGAEDVLVLGSGSFTHDLSRFRFHRPDDPSPPDVAAFAEWFDEGLRAARVEALIDYRRKAPFAAQNHPTEEHLLPVFVALGAAGAHPTAERLHSSAAFGVIRMDAYAFHPA